MLIRSGAFLILFAIHISAGALEVPMLGFGPRESVYPWWALPSDGPVINVTAYGDSILSGLDTDHFFGYISTHGMVERLGQILSQVNDGSVVLVHNRAVAGSQTPSIYREMQQDARYLKNAEYLILDGGGNDFLDLNENPKKVCDSQAYDDVLKVTSQNWHAMVALSKKNISSHAKSIYVLLHFGRYNEVKAERCPNGGSPFKASLESVVRMNYMIAQLAVANHAEVIDDFGMFNCAPTVRDTCDPRRFATADDFVRQIDLYESQGLITDATEWKGDRESPPITLMQNDHIHPNSLGHELLSDRLFDIFGFQR